ncbi:MAG: PSD1 domain-containing protein [Acidobacteria bacterium]|nr:PSD1 domain-containing protein [Acidobacteriota bacterium]
MRSLVWLLVTLPLAAEDAREFFEMRVRPVLVRNCYACHTASRMGGLQLDSGENALKGGNSGPAIVPGDPEKSILIAAVSHTHSKLKMPPQGKLSEAEIADLSAWVKNGAVWGENAPAPAKTPAYAIRPEQREFWSFRPIRKPEPPPGRAAGAIDRFVLAKLEAKGMTPVRPADRRTLIRRATLDLTGLPPTPEEVDAFLADRSPEAFAKVIDRLLASPRYGERWGRYWLDVARYSDDKLDSTGETPYPNSFRYRDWVIQAFNQDMPFDQFVKAQIAGDLMPDKEKHQPGLAFYALRPEFQDDRVDATTRGFLGLTAACAQCHDHKFDPIPTQDFYSLLGIFRNTEYNEEPLAPPEEVSAFQKHKKKIDHLEAEIKQFLQTQATQLAEILATRTAQYLTAAADPKSSHQGLDGETLDRWVKYLAKAQREHPYLPAKDAQEFQAFVLAVNAEKKSIDDQNHIRLGGNRERSNLSNADLLSLERDKYFLWRDLFGEGAGVYYYGAGKIERFLQGEWTAHLGALRARLEALKKALPPQYPFLQVIRDKEKPEKMRVHIRGSAENLGEEAPPHFLSVLCQGEPKVFTRGSGRLELAEAIAGRDNPLTARVMANRIWLHHFGQGLVRTPGNFGQLGDRPSHPELLDYLAARFLESNWSVKAIHREIMLSRTYALSAEDSARNAALDPENRLLWRANRRRLDAEALRDSLLAAGGSLDLTAGGPAGRLTDDNHRRTVYGYISRKKLDGMLALFDFPNPNNTSEQRLTTHVPLQRLFFLNSGLIAEQAKALAARLKGGNAGKITEVYRLLFGRAPEKREVELGLEFVRGGPDAWPRYAQVLLSSNEFTFVN